VYASKPVIIVEPLLGMYIVVLETTSLPHCPEQWKHGDLAKFCTSGNFFKTDASQSGNEKHNVCLHTL